MALAFDATAEVERTGTTDPQTWTHTPVGTPRAVVVKVVHNTSTTDHVSTVTYGGVSLARIVRITNTPNEPGAAEIWFLGTGIPTGAQTVSVDLASATTDDMHFVSETYTAGADTEVIDFDSTSGLVANPSLTMNHAGREGIAVGSYFSGSSGPANFTADAATTVVNTFDFGVNYSSALRQTNASTTDVAIGGTQASDDLAYCAALIVEVAAAGGDVISPYYTSYYSRMIADGGQF